MRLLLKARAFLLKAFKSKALRCTFDSIASKSPSLTNAFGAVEPGEPKRRRDSAAGAVGGGGGRGHKKSLTGCLYGVTGGYRGLIMTAVRR